MTGDPLSTPEDHPDDADVWGHDTANRFERDGVEFGRSLAYIDATFAIATTLLVTSLDPGPKGWSDWASFSEAEQGPLLAFALSFVVISSYWWANHRLVSTLSAISSRFILLSLVLLGCIALMPFTTEGLGAYSSDTDSAVSTVAYSLNIAAVSLVSIGLVIVGYLDKLYRHMPTPAQFRARVIELIDTPVVFLLSIPIAVLVGTTWAHYSWATLIVTGVAIPRYFRRRVPTS
ncbi:hypothetical protein BH10ACT3_BH10ACT3_00620 [soil metagenome]